MKTKKFFVLLDLFIVLSLTSCSKTKMIEKKLGTENADLISIHYDDANNYVAWFYCDANMDKLKKFFIEYDCIDLEEWTFSNTTEKGKFIYEINSSLLKDNIDKELKTGFYIKMNLKLFNKDIETGECQVYYVEFNSPVSNKTINISNYDNYISLEYWSGYHKLGKIF